MLGRATLLYVPAVAAPPAAALLTLVIFSRLLDPAQYGRYMLVLATVELLRHAAFAWIAIGYFRFYAGAERDGTLANLQRTVSTLLATLMVVATLAYAAAVAWLPLELELRDALLLGLVMVLPQTVLVQILNGHRAAGSASLFSLCSAGYAVLGLAAAIALYHFAFASEAALILGVGLGHAVVLAGLLLARGGFAPGRIDPVVARQLLAYAAPVAFSLLLGFVISTSDRYLVAFYLGDAATGQYSVAYNLADRVIGMFFLLVSMAGLPAAITALENHGAEAATRTLRTGCELVLAIGVPATVGMALLAEPIAGVLLGEQFRQSAALVIPWIALAGLLRGFKLFYLDHAFHLGKRTGLALNTVWFPAVLNIALNVLLIPRFGILGAVYATVASFAVAALLSWYLGRRAFAVPLPVAPVVKAVAACVPMALVVLVLDPAAELWALSGAVLAGGVAYGIGAFVLDIARCRTFAMQYLRS